MVVWGGEREVGDEGVSAEMERRDEDGGGTDRSRSLCR